MCAFAQDPTQLVWFRVLQGVTAALLTPGGLAIIEASYRPEDRPAAIGRWAGVSGVAAAAGPLIGGFLLEHGGWRWIFAINVPLIVLTLALVFVAVPPASAVTKRHVDFVGAVLCVLGLGGVVFALIEQPRLGWGSPAILAPLIAGAGAFAAFIAFERRTAEPMVKLELFARRNFSVGNLETLTNYAGLAILFFFLVIFLQQVAGYSAIQSGLTTLPVTLIMFVLSRRLGALADRYGPRLFMAAGPLLSAAGILLLLRTGVKTSYAADLLPALLVFAVGLSMTVAPLTATVLADADQSDAGIASAVNNAVARVAGLAGVAALGPLIGPRLSVSTFHLALGAAAGLLAVAGLLGALLVENPPRRVLAEQCPGGQIAGVARDAAGCSDSRLKTQPVRARPETVASR
jgi:EmrB/QacA subfamily drug resistance transporter